MPETNKKEVKKKYSTLNPSPKLLKTLRNISFNQGGSVSYIFVEERIKFIKKYPKGISYKVKNTTSAPINSQIFFKEVRGKIYKRNPQEILQVFEDTKNDLGASYFIIS